ncbi:hypothetical protein RUND412_005824 [Rhizina undulata]
MAENEPQRASLSIERQRSVNPQVSDPIKATEEARIEVKNIEQAEYVGERRIIFFAPKDPDNPHNWSLIRKAWITFVGILSVSNSTFASSVPSGAASFIKADLHSSTEVTVLTISLFLLGYVVGPIFFAPLSEFYGRKGVSIFTFAWFFIMSVACAVAPNMGALLAFRFLCGMGASAPLSIVGGIYADIWDEPVMRGRCMAIFCACTMIGPVVSPLVSGFVSAGRLGWRMSFWISAIFAGLSFIPVAFLCPETYAPIILLKRAQKMRNEGQADVIAPIELDDRSLKSIFSTTLTRPFRMFWNESIVFLTSLFMSLLYGTFYLFFQSYPIIFQGIYGFTPGMSGLAFLPVGVGSAFACVAVVLWDQYIMRKKKQDPTCHISDEFRRLPLACIGGPVYVISLFWQAWTSKAEFHFMVPAMAGVPFGFGFSLIFMACFNYMTDAYEIYSASALAAASMCRSLFGAVFPLFAKKMYGSLGIPWASSLLGFAAMGMSIIPFLFIKYGTTIRARSKFSQFILERKKLQAEEEKARAQEYESQNGDSDKDLEKSLG